VYIRVIFDLHVCVELNKETTLCSYEGVQVVHFCSFLQAMYNVMLTGRKLQFSILKPHVAIAGI